MRRALALSCGLLLYGGTLARAGDLAITPIRLELSARQSIATMRIRNAGSSASSLQMRVFAWRQVDGEDVLKRTDDVLANPGAFDLAPGAEQLARIGLGGPPVAASTSYRVLIEELPRRGQEQAGVVTTLLRVSIPIFVEPASAAPRLQWSLRGRGPNACLEVANAGAAHVQLTRLTFTDAAGRVVVDEPVSAYVLPGAERRIPLPRLASVAPGQTLKLTAATDGQTLSDALVAPSGGNEAAIR